jgi:hypothetical protein
METEIFLLTEIFYSVLNLLISLKGGNYSIPKCTVSQKLFVLLYRIELFLVNLIVLVEESLNF